MKTITQLKATTEQIQKHSRGGHNFITPDVIGYYFIPHSKHKAEMVVELYQGWFIDKYIYGVTCSNNNQSYDELSKSFDNSKEAVEYINSLK